MKLSINSADPGEYKVALVGLGYVGLPIAIEFSKKVPVIGYDIDEEKTKLYKDGVDPTLEVGDEAVATCSVEFTDEAERLCEANFYVVAVPTPINQDKTPDLTPVIEASRIVGEHMNPGSIVVFESTVYPGVTEDVCVPISKVVVLGLTYKENCSDCRNSKVGFQVRKPRLICDKSRNVSSSHKQRGLEGE